MSASESTAAKPTKADLVVAIVAEPAVQRPLGALMRQHGYTVQPADRIEDVEGAGVAILACKDLRSEEVDGIRRTLRRQPDLRVIVLARTESPRRVRRALEAGASGFVFEREARHALPAAIHAALARQICVPEEFRRQVVKPTLTTREKQILGLVVMGLSNGEISRRLFLAESTVKSHLSAAFSKLGVQSRNEATALILDPDFGFGPGILRISDGDSIGASLVSTR
jgi:DNA-binding NarL/FixJ family response regulator